MILGVYAKKNTKNMPNINCQRKAHRHLKLYFSMPARLSMPASSFRLNALLTERGASNFTIAEREKIEVRSLIEWYERK
jgi:hypothetical protein